jgi:HEAT repeat protein
LKPDDAWSVVELARAQTASTRARIDGDAIAREVIDAGEPLAPVRSEDVPSLVEALLASRRGSEERRDLASHLVSAGPEAAAALVARLPGPLEAGGSLADGAPIAEWGPVFAGVAAAGLAAEQPLLAALHDSDPERRIAALALVLRLGAPGGLAAIAALVQDDDPRVAAEAANALASSRGLPVLSPIVAEIRRALASGRPVKASRAARALGRLGDADSVPVLIQMLDAGGDLTAAVSDALTAITMQRLGSDPLRWIHWWREWRAAPRSSWLFHALTSPDPELRRRAATELRRAGEPPQPFDPDGPEPDRRRAALAWSAWWREAGLAL